MGGEILGVAGIAGSGQRELLESIAGLYPVAEGSSIRYTPEGAPESELVGKTPMQIKKSGVALAFVPEDRLGMGLVGSMGMTGNMMRRSRSSPPAPSSPSAVCPAATCRRCSSAARSRPRRTC